MPDYYDILEVSRDATPDVIRRSYHKLALRYHPDKAGPEGAAKFKEIHTAYEVLSDPQKKAIYDKYGETGLNAMDNPAMAPAMTALGPGLAMAIVFFLIFIIGVMILLFLAFLAAFNDGNLRSWNFVKVFSPLFVIDGLTGVPALILLIALPCALRGPPMLIAVGCILAYLCLIVLSIVIPVAKDRNDDRAAAGRIDFLKWRVWLIPGYLFSFFVFIVVFLVNYPSKERMMKRRAYGLRQLANYLPVSCVLRLLAALCVPVLFALVACRADGLLSTNYFVIIGVPCFVFGAIVIVDAFLCKLLGNLVYMEQEATDPEGQPRHTDGITVCTCSHIATTICTMTGMVLFWGLLFASVAMICVRLNHHSWYGTYADVPSLGKALIPIFLMVGLLVLVVLLCVLVVACQVPGMEGADAAADAQHAPEEEANQDQAQQTHPENDEEAEYPQEDPNTPAAAPQAVGAAAAGPSDSIQFAEEDGPPPENAFSNPTGNVSDID